jgi:hypothetical protein
MHGHGDLIADFDAREIHQGGVKDDALGISYLRNRFGHDVILCFTRLVGKKKLRSDVRHGESVLRRIRGQRSETVRLEELKS